MTSEQQSAINKAVGEITRTRRLQVYIGDSNAAEEFVGHAVWANDTHLIVNLEDGRKVFFLRSTVTRLIESPL